MSGWLTPSEKLQQDLDADPRLGEVIGAIRAKQEADMGLSERFQNVRGDIRPYEAARIWREFAGAVETNDTNTTYTLDHRTLSVLVMLGQPTVEGGPADDGALRERIASAIRVLGGTP